MEQMEVDVDMSAKPSTSSSAAAGSSMAVDKTADQNPQPQGNIHLATELFNLSVHRKEAHQWQVAVGLLTAFLYIE